MKHLGAELVHVAPGAVDIELKMRRDLTQQHGFFHAGATSSIADSSAGYAALSLFAADCGVLTSEYKINFMAPGVGDLFIGRGEVVKATKRTCIRANINNLICCPHHIFFMLDYNYRIA